MLTLPPWSDHGVVGLLLTSDLPIVSLPSAVVSWLKKDANAAPTAASAVPIAAKPFLFEPAPWNASIADKKANTMEAKHGYGTSDWKMARDANVLKGGISACGRFVLRHG